MDFEELGDCPGIFIPCETIEDLQYLVLQLFEKEILDDDTDFLLMNSPDDMLEILNDPLYFEPIEICGVKVIRGKLKMLEIKKEDLL